MVRTFVFDDGQTWHMQLMRVAHGHRETVSIAARFWADGAPEQRVIGRVSPRGFALSDTQLAEALRQALRGLTLDARLDA